MIANEYGQPDGEISATHHEYRLARKLKLPTIVFLKGAKDDTRSAQVQALIAETKKDGYTYKRFYDREDLKPLMLQALQRTLAETFEIKASAAEISEGEQLIDAASTFESAVLADVAVGQLDQGVGRRLQPPYIGQCRRTGFSLCGRSVARPRVGSPWPVA